MEQSLSARADQRPTRRGGGLLVWWLDRMVPVGFAYADLRGVQLAGNGQGHTFVAHASGEPIGVAQMSVAPSLTALISRRPMVLPRSCRAPACDAPAWTGPAYGRHCRSALTLHTPQ